MRRFYWIEEGVLAGCSRPGSDDAAISALDDDLGTLRARGIGAILSLTETAVDGTALQAADIECLHIPVPDLTAPDPGQIGRALHFIDLQRSTGRAVAVHCLQGQGRTGVILAAYLVRSGVDPDTAIERVRVICPGALGVQEQEAAIHAFSARRDWIV